MGNGSCEAEGKDSDGRGSKGTSGPGDALLWCPRAIENKPELRKSHGFKTPIGSDTTEEVSGHLGLFE